MRQTLVLLRASAGLLRNESHGDALGEVEGSIWLTGARVLRYKSEK